MNNYKFAALPSNDSVASAVTFAVCAWFLVAAAAMIAERPAPKAGPVAAALATRVMYAAPAVAISPEARLIIVVEGRRA